MNKASCCHCSRLLASLRTRFTVCLGLPMKKLSSNVDSVSEVCKSGITMSVRTSLGECLKVVFAVTTSVTYWFYGRKFDLRASMAENFDLSADDSSAESSNI